MEGGVTLATIMENVGSLTTGVTTMFSSLSQYWFVFLPLSMTLFSFIFGKMKSLLFFKKGKRR